MNFGRKFNGLGKHVLHVWMEIGKARVSNSVVSAGKHRGGRLMFWARFVIVYVHLRVKEDRKGTESGISLSLVAG